MNDFRILLVVPVAVAWMLSAGCDKKLDDARAVAAKDYLVQVGIPSQQISVISYPRSGSCELQKGPISVGSNRLSTAPQSQHQGEICSALRRLPRSREDHKKRWSTPHLSG